MPRLVGVCSSHTLNIWAFFLTMEEIWKPVLGYEGLYEVSSLGQLRSVDRVIAKKDGRVTHLKGRILAHRINKKRKNYQYFQVELSGNGAVKTFRVSLLVCEAFHGKKPGGCQCMHLDGDPQNDRADNLAWGTIHENSNEPIRRRRLSESAPRVIRNHWKNGVYDNQLRPCLQYSLSGELIKEFRSIRDAERETGISHNTISRACCGKLKTSGGFIWEYKNH